MFTLVQSNHMERLAKRLADELNQASGNVLASEQILVQSPGMATWLRLEIAAHNGIAAALSFPLPSNFIWSLCYALLPGVPKENAFTKDAMTWKLMALLPRLIEMPHFEPLRDYLSSDSPLKLFQLASRVADIFDQYLVYRPDWIVAWEKGENSLSAIGSTLTQEATLPDNCLWQPLLWRALVQYNRDELGQSHWHRANLHQALVAALSNPTTDISALPRRLYVFGISSLPPQTLEVLYALGSRVPVTMLSLSPCRQYWGDIVDSKLRAKLALKYKAHKMLPEHWEETLEVGNPLLAANGKMGRELLDLVLSLPPEHFTLDDSGYEENDDSHLLGRLQNDILDMEVAGTPLCADLARYQSNEGKFLLDEQDNSLVLRSCHSPLREVETLHDHLLGLLSDSQGTLCAKDIVVMLPDVAAYAPFIDAVFASRRGEHYIPYAIADRGAVEESPLLHGFLTLLDINHSRFGLSEILGLLEIPAVMAKFKLDEEELSRLGNWLSEAGVRWGRDAQSRERLGLPAFDKHSWAFGIRRLLLGFSLGDEGDFYHGTLPFAGVEGQQAQCIGKLLDFIEHLDEFAARFAAADSLVLKFAELSRLTETLFAPLPEYQEELNLIRETLSDTQKALQSSASSESNLSDISLEVIRQTLASKLTDARVGQRFLAGSVNFCTLMPMRSIPFNVVCLLGMNEGIYPRVQHPVGFDLMAKTPARRGDRSRRLDDRYLFLEALLSAREQLYISFIGRSERDDSERLPSMLVSELLDCCELSAYVPQGSLVKRLVKQQPLQPFDQRLYLPHQDITASFAAQWCPQEHRPPKPFIDAALDEVDEDEQKMLELASLIRFYRDPARFFCQRRLRLDLSHRLDALDDSEPFDVDALGRYQLQDKMLNAALEADEVRQQQAVDTLCDRLAGAGALPMAPFDKLLFTSYQRDLAPILDRCRFIMGETEGQSLRISLALNKGHKLVGTIDKVFAKGLLVARPGTAKAKDVLALYLRHLCLCASGYRQSSFLLDVGNFHAFLPLTPDNALASLEDFISHYFEAVHTPSPLIPALAMTYIEALAEGASAEESLAEISTKWDDGNGMGEIAEPHNERLFEFPASFATPAFTVLAERLWRPLLGRCYKGKLGDLADFVSNPSSIPPLLSLEANTDWANTDCTEHIGTQTGNLKHQGQGE
ncbi:exodeoxyribonuclease V subunit gamma [Shewanella sp. FJAT-52076]|uniref:exodeoxyribonuclease V subunit gamma n=1 Tax=Shewanella sp. FJAT-52076 TaxID=2864202 RepID=UPI001C65C1DF|nr:exodeoxyribonuclease V subunit gamma [Shewanella sp. FJAT-52076]QYJ73709.1 exodeoxyribonuclease V subunit gamma [Shewanella sp. FJAT-52076]